MNRNSTDDDNTGTCRNTAVSPIVSQVEGMIGSEALSERARQNIYFALAQEFQRKGQDIDTREAITL